VFGKLKTNRKNPSGDFVFHDADEGREKERKEWVCG
jgi:hypothetical protein